MLLHASLAGSDPKAFRSAFESLPGREAVNLSRIGHDDLAKKSYWTDVYPTVHAIPYNSKRVAGAALPRHCAGLPDAKRKGKLGLNRNNFMFIAALLDSYGKEEGEEFLQKLAG